MLVSWGTPLLKYNRYFCCRCLFFVLFCLFFLAQHSCLCDTLVSIYMRLRWSRFTLRIAWIENGRSCLSGLWLLSPRHSFGVYVSLGVLLPDKKMSKCGSGLRLVKSLKKKSENVMQKYIETKSNIINHQLSNYFGLSSGATPWIFTKLHNCKTFYLIRFQHRRKHYQRHYGPRRWLLWPLILVW